MFLFVELIVFQFKKKRGEGQGDIYTPVKLQILVARATQTMPWSTLRVLLNILNIAFVNKQFFLRKVSCNLNTLHMSKSYGEGGGGFIIHCFVSPDAFIAPTGVQRRKGKKLTLKN